MAWKNVQYENGKMRTSEGGGGGGSSTFAGLDDVSFNNIQNGQVPKYNSTTQKWENADESGGGGTVTDVQVDGVSVVNPQGVAEIEMPEPPEVPVEDVEVNGESVVNAQNVAEIKSYKEVTLAEYQALPSSKTSDGVMYCIKDVGGANQFPPLIYSDEEREVGVWRDGKPLYQKVFAFNQRTIIPAGAWTDTGFSANDISTVVFVSGHDIQSNKGTVWHFLGADVTGTDIRLYQNRDGSKEIGLTHFVMMYTKTTDTAGSGTWTTQGGYAHHYSTSEKVIGTWVDGKPIYEKVWVLNTAASLIPNTFLSDLSIRWVVDLYLMLWDSSDMYKYYIAYNTESKKLTHYPSPDRWVYCLCAQYTKTTD